MIEILKHQSVIEKNIPFGLVQVSYPPLDTLHRDEFFDFADKEIQLLKEKYSDYDRKAVFGNNPYTLFFKKFKKTFFVTLQFESVILKDRPFPRYNAVTAVPFLFELTTHSLSGTHDVDCMEGPLQLYISEARDEFMGMRGETIHTYPGDMAGRDDKDIILSEIAGRDMRTKATENSRNVFYPVFGTPDMPREDIEKAVKILVSYIKILSPDATIETMVI